MKRSVTVSVRSLMTGVVVTGVLALALVTAYLLGSAGGGGSPAGAVEPGVATAGAVPARTLTMVGRGTVVAVPDQLTFALSVGATRSDLATALDDASRSMAKVLAALTPYGVQRADVQTTGLSMFPVYDYHSSGPPTLRGYRVQQRASVLVKELKQGGKAVTAAVDAGGNAVRVRDIRLKVGDPEAVLERARDAAVAQAQAKAEQYAAAAGQELGDVLTLREVGSANRSAIRTSPTNLDGLVYGRAAAAALPVRAGRQDLAVTVQVVWEFA